MTHYSIENLEPLYNTLKKHAEETPAEVLNLYEEVGVTRFITQQCLAVYADAVNAEQAVKGQLNISPDDPLLIEKYNSIYASKSAIEKKLQDSLSKTVNITKRAAEVDSLLVNQFNGLTVLTIIAQIDSYLREFLEDNYMELAALFDRNSIASKDPLKRSEIILEIVTNFKEYFSKNLNIDTHETKQSAAENAAVSHSEVLESLTNMMATVPDGN